MPTKAHKYRKLDRLHNSLPFHRNQQAVDHYPENRTPDSSGDRKAN